MPCSKDELEAVFEVFPLRSAEQLRDRTDRVQAALWKIAERLKSIDTPIERNPWIVLIRSGSVRWVRLEDIAPSDTNQAKRAQRNLAFATVVLPVEVGGLNDGMLKGDKPPPEDAQSLDVAEATPDGTPTRQRVVVKGDESRALFVDTIPDGVVMASVILASSDDYAEPKRIEYRVAKGQAREPGQRVPLGQHNEAVSKAADRFGRALGLDDHLVTALRIAGRWHDAGKARAIWQRYANNSNAAEPIAKSDRYGHWKQLAGYRHEFGSLHDAAAADEIRSLDADTRDLVLHLIAAHHGWARPYFEPRHFDPRPRPTAANEQAAVETMQRFARLQQRHGRWGLAWLESIFRCADAAGSELSGPVENGGRTSSRQEGTSGGAA